MGVCLLGEFTSTSSSLSLQEIESPVALVSLEALSISFFAYLNRKNMYF